MEHDERLKRKLLKKKFTKSDDGDELLQFNDSIRESVEGYLEAGQRMKRVDTPTRLLSASNSFLPVDRIHIDL